MTTEPVTGDQDSTPPSFTNDCVLVLERDRTLSVSSSEFEGGSPGHETGGTPGDMTTTTPSTLSSRGEAANFNGECESEADTSFYSDTKTEVELDVTITKDSATQTSAFCVHSLSSKTCLELIGKLSNEQLEFEL